MRGCGTVNWPVKLKMQGQAFHEDLLEVFKITLTDSWGFLPKFFIFLIQDDTSNKFNNILIK